MKNFIKAAVAAVALVSFAGVAHAEGDAVKGAKVFKKCKACHSIGPKAKNKVGPVLTGVIGRPAASYPKFKYGKLIKGAAALGLVWDEAMLDKYLAKKGVNKALKGFIKAKGGKPKGKSKMAFAGLKKDAQRADVIAYLKTFSVKAAGMSGMSGMGGMSGMKGMGGMSGMKGMGGMSGMKGMGGMSGMKGMGGMSGMAGMAAREGYVCAEWVKK